MGIESPCVQRCELHPVHQHCLGCGRALREIAEWTRYSVSERKRIMQALPARLAALQGGNEQ